MRSALTALLIFLFTSACAQKPPAACTPPRPAWGKPRNFGLVPMNEIALDRTGALYWNGRSVTKAALDGYLDLMHTLDPEPVTFLETEMGVPCASLDAIRNQMERRLNCSNGGRCSEGVVTVWDKIPSTGPMS